MIDIPAHIKLDVAIAARTKAEQHLSQALAAKIAADDALAHAGADHRDALAKSADEFTIALRDASDAAFAASQRVTAVLTGG
jgi:hypothetical protein